MVVGTRAGLVSFEFVAAVAAVGGEDSLSSPGTSTGGVISSVARNWGG